jgi:hypothetical protein
MHAKMLINPWMRGELEKLPSHVNVLAVLAATIHSTSTASQPRLVWSQSKLTAIQVANVYY